MFSLLRLITRELRFLARVNELVRAVGIDPGTMSMDIYGFDDESNEVLIDESVPREEVTRRPSMIMEKIKGLKDIDAVVGPSGYGLPLTRAKDATERDIRLATFISDREATEKPRILGLREIMRMMREERGIKAWFTPGVIHLATVPLHRKFNKVDMGTADKVFSVALAIKDQADLYGIGYSDTSFILVEIGYAYNAAIAVNMGRIVDGVGGTTGEMGYLGAGFMDAELAYGLANALGRFRKKVLFTGGASYIAFNDNGPILPDEFVKKANEDHRCKVAYEAMVEGILKDVARLLPSLRRPREVILSGRFTRISSFVEDVKKRIEEFLDDLGTKANVRTVRKKATVAKEAAEGAAVIANGIAGGKYKGLVETMELNSSHGTIFDYVYLGDEARERLNDYFS